MVELAAPADVAIHSSFDDLDATWSELARAGRNAFATIEWHAAWWRHFGGDRPRHIVEGRGDDGRPRFLLPCYVASSFPVPVLRFIGHGLSDQLGPIGAPEHHASAGRALRAAMGGGGLPSGVFVADDLPPTCDWPQATGGRVLGYQASPVVTLSGTGERGWEAWLAGRSANLRATLRRSQRALERRGHVRVRLSDDPDRLDRDIDTLVELHAKRWPDGASRTFTGARAAFHRDVMRTFLERGWLRLWFLEVDGVAVAGLYNVRFEGTECFYQSGRDPAIRDSSPGLVLHAHAIRTAFRDGLDEYRLLRGDERYKGRLADRDDGLATVVVACGPTARAMAGVIEHGRRLPASVRRRLPASLAWGVGGEPLPHPP
jgi:CelD/BcsL family acetyltransferase involved in cellulose biosynthesis